MNISLDNLYFEWLCSQVEPITRKHSTKHYWLLLRQLYNKEFVWIVPNDDNRVEDGRDLRITFRNEKEIEIDPDWMHLPCSVLEMLIALSNRLSFQADGEPRNWFWRLLENLELVRFNDIKYRENPESEAVIDEALDRLIFRTYSFDGSLGGLFPLQYPMADQREIEIWYQMAAYLNENE